MGTVSIRLQQGNHSWLQEMPMLPKWYLVRLPPGLTCDDCGSPLGKEGYTIGINLHTHFCDALCANLFYLYPEKEKRNEYVRG